MTTKSLSPVLLGLYQGTCDECGVTDSVGPAVGTTMFPAVLCNACFAAAPTARWEAE